MSKKTSTSQLSGFFRRTLAQRLRHMANLLEAPDDSRLEHWQTGGLTSQMADQMVENAIGVMGFPVGICTNLQINGRDRLVPMVTEESSVIAAASNAAKWLRAGGGVQASSTPAEMIGQLQLLDLPDPQHSMDAILAAKKSLLQCASKSAPGLVKRGGGPRDIEVRLLPPLAENDPLSTMLVVHVIVDVCDAMGANAVNTICEALAPSLAKLSQGRVRLRILSNLSDRRLVTVKGRIPFTAFCKKEQPLSLGRETAHGIEEASLFAERDPYRAATHNKGIMNGADAVLLATGQDFRAIEAGAHAYASRTGRYTALATWRVRDEALHGELCLPMAVGTVGGITSTHPTVKNNLEVMGVQRAHELAEIVAAVGLAQNVAALRALAMEGIQRGHMGLHARNIAVEVGATGEEIPRLAQELTRRGDIRRATAQQLLRQMKQPLD